MKSILGFLASGLFALFAALVIAALQIGGVISMAVVKILLVVAWLVGVGGIVLSGIMLAHPPRHKIVVSGGAAIILGGLLLWLNSWIAAHGPRTIPAPISAGSASASVPIMTKPAPPEPAREQKPQRKLAQETPKDKISPKPKAETTDRSVKIGGRAQVTNSAIATGEHAQATVVAPSLWNIDEGHAATMIDAISKYEPQSVAVSSTSSENHPLVRKIVATISAAKWRAFGGSAMLLEDEPTIGLSVRASTKANEAAARALVKALTDAGIRVPKGLEHRANDSNADIEIVVGSRP